MARLMQPVDKRGLCLVRMLAGERLGGNKTRLYKVHIMDIAHPDVDGVMERLFEEVKVQDTAEEFFAKGGAGAYTAEAIAKAKEAAKEERKAAAAALAATAGARLIQTLYI
jgi:hypothetical protein